MADHEPDPSPMRTYFGRLEEALIDEFLEARGYDHARLAALPDAQRDALLKDASVYASSKLAEVESRSHLLREIHR